MNSYPLGTRAGTQSRYELYIGYRHEAQGWNVEYNSLIPGSNGLIRGLICRKQDKARIVHCLFRPSNDTINANFIYLLFAMAWEYKDDYPQLKVSARFFTPAGLDAKAKESADKFNVKASELFPFRDFPYVKCIITSSRQRMYYTPYDNEYFTVNATKRLRTTQQVISQRFTQRV